MNVAYSIRHQLSRNATLCGSISRERGHDSELGQLQFSQPVWSEDYFENWRRHGRSSGRTVMLRVCWPLCTIGGSAALECIGQHSPLWSMVTIL